MKPPDCHVSFRPDSIEAGAAGKSSQRLPGGLSTGFRAAWVAIVAMLAVAGFSRAFPPLPSYILYGILRGEDGRTISAADAEVLLLKDGEVAGRVPLQPNLQVEQTYELPVPLDSGREATALYSAAAVESGGLFSVAVQIGDRRFYPIEVTGTLRAGKGGERVRLDLTLGQDSDGDGLPDAWEFEQLFRSGRLPGGNGWDLSLIDKSGDFDKDGQSNFAEYISGTGAGESSDRLVLEIKEVSSGWARLEFFALTGKTYTLQSSPDLKAWTTAEFATAATVEEAAAAPAVKAHTSTAVGVVTLWCRCHDLSTQTFRLTVR